MERDLGEGVAPSESISVATGLGVRGAAVATCLLQLLLGLLGLLGVGRSLKVCRSGLQTISVSVRLLLLLLTVATS